MKIRQGFVSNSSTSSFLIYGICLEKDKLLDKLNADTDGSDEENEDFDFYDFVYELEKEIGLDCHIPYEDEVFIGESWDQIEDDETGAEFKARVEKVLKEKFGDDLEFGTYAEAWRDG